MEFADYLKKNILELYKYELYKIMFQCEDVGNSNNAIWLFPKMIFLLNVTADSFFHHNAHGRNTSVGVVTFFLDDVT